MPLQTIPSGTVQVDLATANTTYVLQTGDSIVSSADGINAGTLNSVSVFVYGTVLSGDDAIVDAIGNTGLTVVVGTGGQITGNSDGISVYSTGATIVNYGQVFGDDSGGIELLDSGTVTTNRSSIENYGYVYGGDDGVFLSQSNADLYNSGTISGDSGVYIFGSGCRVFNSGTITSTTPGDFAEAAIESGTAIYIENSGLLQGTRAVFGSNQSDTVVNSGSMVGTVELNDGDDTYLGREMGAAYDGVFGGAGNDYLQGGGADDYFEGDGGQDTLIGNAGADSLSGGSNNDTLIGGDGDDTLAGGAADDKLKGGDQDDLLDGGNGNDTLIGGRGEDTLIGGSGQDSLTGGADADVFQFLSASETPASGSRDRILDFELGVDLIDVSAIANFTFIGTAAFSLTPGELRLFESQNGNTKVIMDIDGDGLNDAEITVVGVQGLTAGDFIL